MDKDPATPLLVGRGFLATASAVIDCKKAKIAVGKGITMLIFGVKEIDLGNEEVLYWTTLGKQESYELRPSTDGIVFRKMVDFIRAIPINLKGTMWVSEGLVDKRIDWNRTPKEGMERGTLRLN
ncbi:hypothetical protein Tco_0872309 [Tanacetum coccineum]